MHLAARPGLGVIVAGALALACGIRTGPPEEDTGSDESGVPPGPDPREGSCDNPFVLPFANYVVRGRLQGPGRDEGWCGDGENDAGAEDTYLITPKFDTDVLVFVTPETEFEASLRVTRDGCYSDDANLPRMCAAPVGDHPYWHFFAQAGHEYSLTIDSPAETDGRYGLQIFYSPPELTACPVHEVQIDQAPGGHFMWSNTLGGRGGRVDGFCGGPGNENMFQLNVWYPGLISFQVQSEPSFAPILSVRTGCGGTTELECTSMEQQGSSTFSLSRFFEPGTYYVVVDQGGVAGGEYLLDVFSE